MIRIWQDGWSVTYLFAQSGGLLVAPNKAFEFEAVGPIELIVTSFAAKSPSDGPGFAGFTVFYGFPINIK
jgi:hypothetical protein